MTRRRFRSVNEPTRLPYVTLAPTRVCLPNKCEFLSDLEGEKETEEGRGASSPPNLVGNAEARAEVMSVCFEPNTVLPTSASTVSEPKLLEAAPVVCNNKEVQDSSLAPPQNVAKLVLTNALSSSCNTAPILQKVPSSSVITVVNATGPLTIFKTLCSNSCATTAPQFTLVNSAPLNVSNAAVGKPITVVGAPPITVVRAISSVPVLQTTEESTKTTDTVCTVTSINGPVAPERPVVHNVFVKNSTALPPELISTVSDVAQVQKLLPASTFLQNTVIQTIAAGAITKTTNGQKLAINNNNNNNNNNKLKIISNVIVPQVGNVMSASPNNSNIILNASVAPKHYVQQKMINSSLNGTPKFINRTPTTNNLVKAGTSGNKPLTNTKNQKLVYPTHKSQIRTIPPVNNNNSKAGIKTLSPQPRGISSQQVQRTSSGLRTIPPQRPPKVPNKPNYIGKHAIQAQKFKNPHMAKTKGVKPPIPTVNNVFPHRTPQNTGVTYHQALTANIIQSLSETSSCASSGGSFGGNRGFDFSSARYDGSNHGYSEGRCNTYSDAYLPPAPKPQSNLEALSFVCQAVLLDHNYNATPPTEPPPRIAPTAAANNSVQLNGASVPAYYSPTNSTRNNRSSLSASTNTLSTLSSVSGSSLLPSNTTSGILHDDDAASDISCGSERKHETEGEETDTAPEAEVGNNDDTYDHYGDSITRCICGFLHDDGYMIQCDKCKVWQHVRCVIKNNKKVPEDSDYLCEMCDATKPVDKGKARSLQQQWMRDNQEREAKLRKEVRMREIKLKETLSDSESSDAEPAGGNAPNKTRVVLAGRRKSELTQRQNSRQRKEPARPENVIRRNVKRKERKFTKKKSVTRNTSIQPKLVAKSPSEDEAPDTWAHAPINQLPQLRQWIENYEEAVTNHYSPELRARISNIRINGIHSDLETQVDTSVHKCRVYTQPLTSLKYLVSTMHLVSNTLVVELRGKYMLSTQHRGNTASHGGTLTTRQHAQRPGPFLFFYRLHKDNTEVCVDTRTYGNDARFIRRSCRPNCELRHCIEKGVLHLYVVTVATIDKNLELTIKHESHDLAAIGTTHISCACGNHDECLINKGPLKKNGENSDIAGAVGFRKKRGRRTASAASEQEAPPLPPLPLPLPPAANPKLKEETPPPASPMEVKPEPDVKVEPEVKQEEGKVKVEEQEEVKEETSNIPNAESETVKEEEDELRSPSPPLSAAVTRRLYKSDTEEKKEGSAKESASAVDKRKLSREERKIEAYMKAFERMERQQQRKQEHQAKQAHRRESEPGPMPKEEDKSEPKIKRRRRKGRSRTVSTNSQARRNRLNSADSSYATSGDEYLLSPNDNGSSHNRMLMGGKESSTFDNSPSKEAGLLLALAHCENSNRSELRSPIPDVDCNSNSANSSPETPLSSACLLVAAAVEPLEPSFKFPKTKKGLMNEWLNKSPECVQSASSISPSSLTPHIPVPLENNFYESTASNFFSPSKNLVALAQAANYCDLPSQPHGNAKKRWLRQAIIEDQCDSPTGRPDSPPLSEMVAPPKKRRLPRESLSTEGSPSTTPTNPNPPGCLMGGDDSQFQEQEDRVEIVTAVTDGDSPSQVLIDDAALTERVAEMQQEIGACFRLPEPRDLSQKDETVPAALRCVLDPRLARPIFNNSDLLVATVEKNLSILGFEDQRADNAPTKRKLSITEYRRRKQQSVNEKMVDEPASEENTLSQSPPQKMRARSDSTSSATSFLSSDDEIHTPELPPKALSAFNSEPTELEKQRESVSLRLKKAFGLSIDEDSSKPALNMETLLNCELDPPPVKTNSIRFSPTFPIPGSSNNTMLASTQSPPVASPPMEEPSTSPKDSALADPTKMEEEEEEAMAVVDVEGQNQEQDVSMSDLKENQSELKSEVCHSEDKSEKQDKVSEQEEEGKDAKGVVHMAVVEGQVGATVTENSAAYDGVESTNYVPPFNNPVYPNSSFTSFGSLMDDDVPYEGRNPSPPPELNSAPDSYSPS